jgi:transporter family-2 protein
MSCNVLTVLVAVAGGVAISVQAQFLGLLDRGMGALESVFVTYTGGFLLISLPILMARGGKLGIISTVPWYALLSGAVGLVIVGSVGYSAQRLGVVVAFTIIVTSQFVTGVLIDQFGFMGATVHPLDITRCIGILLLLSGVWMIIR